MTPQEFLEEKGIDILTVKGLSASAGPGKVKHWSLFTIMEEYAKLFKSECKHKNTTLESILVTTCDDCDEIVPPKNRI